MPRGIPARSESVTEQLARFSAQRSQLDQEEKKARESIRTGLAARLMKQVSGADVNLQSIEELVIGLERSGLAAVAKAASALPTKPTTSRGRGKDEGLGEKETGADA